MNSQIVDEIEKYIITNAESFIKKQPGISEASEKRKQSKTKIMVSSCLLGFKVRYNGKTI